MNPGAEPQTDWEGAEHRWGLSPLLPLLGGTCFAKCSGTSMGQPGKPENGGTVGTGRENPTQGLRLEKQSLNSALEPLAGDAEDEGEEAGGSIMRLSCEGGRIPEQKQREE